VLSYLPGFRTNPTAVLANDHARPEDVRTAYASFLDGKKPNPATVVHHFERVTRLFEKPIVRDPSPSPLLADAETFNLYIRALANVKREPGESTVDEKWLGARSAREKRLGLTAGEATAASSETSAAPFTEPKSDGASLPIDGIVSSVMAKKAGPTSSVRLASGGATASAGSSYGGAVSASGASPAPIRVIVEEAKGTGAWRFARGVISIVLYAFILLTVLALIMDTGGNALRAVASGAAGNGPTAITADSLAHKVTFDDVQGCEEAKEELKEIVDFLKDPTRFSRLGGRLPRGVLLTGPPGTGKTLLARAVAGEAGVNMFICSGSEFDEVFVGVGAKRVRELFETARKNSPAVIFIDELDAVGGKRSTRDMQHLKQTLNQLLVEMDGFAPTDQIVVIGATNLGDALDSALTRPGRFDRHVPVPLPDVRGRLAILRRHTTGVQVAADVDLTDLARGTPGFSGAELENLVNSAAIKASVDNLDTVPITAFEWAKDKIMMGAERKSAVITPESRLKTAYHEAGHALAAYYSEHADPVHKVTVLPRGHALGITFQLPPVDRDSLSFLQYRARLDVCMGGRAAEEVVYGREQVTSGAMSDIQAATKAAHEMIRHCGFSDKVGLVSLPQSNEESAETRAMVDTEVRSFIEQAHSRAMELLQKRRSELELLARALVERETLTGDEVRELLSKGRLTTAPPV